jgi:sugar phosphate isomerase/epimerase
MEIGILTAPFGGEPLEVVAAFAGEHGFAALEVAAGPGSKHIDITHFTQADAERVLELMERRALRISSVAMYTNTTPADPQERARVIDLLKKAVDSAQLLGVDVVCTLGGMPVPGKDKFKTIQEDCTQVFPPVLDYAGERGIKIALENWYATNMQGLEHWKCMFDAVPHENFGLNFDPSHLIWQGIDYVAAVHHFGKRIFHTHAKDTEIREDKLRWLGNQAHGWWRYVIPGFGAVRWGEYIGALRSVGYDGVLSIEHEDRAFGREEGFLAGKRYLSQFV